MPSLLNSILRYIRTPPFAFGEFGINIFFWRRRGWEQIHHLTFRKVKIEVSKGHFWRKVVFRLYAMVLRYLAHCCLFCKNTAIVLASIEDVIFNISFLLLSSVNHFGEDALYVRWEDGEDDCIKWGMEYLYSALGRCFAEH